MVKNKELLPQQNLPLSNVCITDQIMYQRRWDKIEVFSSKIQFGRLCDGHIKNVSGNNDLKNICKIIFF